MNDPVGNDHSLGLARALTEGVDCLASLKLILIEERDALRERDPDRLEETASRKDAVLRNLMQFERLGAECAALDGTDSPLADKCQAFVALARECDQLNRANGMVIRMRHKHVTEGLSILRGGHAGATDIYTASGASAAATHSQALGEA